MKEGKKPPCGPAQEEAWVCAGGPAGVPELTERGMEQMSIGGRTGPDPNGLHVPLLRFTSCLNWFGSGIER